VASQIALTLVLLTVALSFHRAFQAEYGRGPGFRTDHLLLATVDPALARLDQRQAEAFYKRVKERAAAIPGVTAAAVTSFVPLSMGGGFMTAIVPEGVDSAPGAGDIRAAAARVDDSYLDTMGIPIVSGRGLHASDGSDTPRVAVVSRGLAVRFWPGQNPLGKRLRVGGPDAEWTEIVGVAADVKFQLFTPTSAPFLYLPRLQNPSARSTLVVRTTGEPATVATALRTAVLETNRDVPVLLMRTMEAFYPANSRNLNTVVVRTIAGMGAMGLTLALIGLYGLTAFAVNRRTREIGIRMAMGALPGSVLRLVMRQAALPAGAGIVLGVLTSLAAGGAIESVFPNTGGDSVTFLLIVPAVLVVVALATYVPARRAALIDPLAALRQD
jgi:predicted permease